MPGEPVSIVRPTYVVGPYDHTRRFTWWVERVARGGPVLAPGPKENPLQVIDARDLARFVVLLAHGQAAGTFHAVSPAPPFSFEDFLTTVVDAVGPPGTELIWVEAEALAKAGVTDAELPLWAGVDAGGDHGCQPGTSDCRRATGATARPDGPRGPRARTDRTRRPQGVGWAHPRPGERAARPFRLSEPGCLSLRPYPKPSCGRWTSRWSWSCFLRAAE